MAFLSRFDTPAARAHVKGAHRDRATVSGAPCRASPTSRARAAGPSGRRGRGADGLPGCPAGAPARDNPAQPGRVACRDRAQRRPSLAAAAPEIGTTRGVCSARGVGDARDSRGAREPAERAGGGRAVPGCARPLVRRDGGADGHVGERRDDAPAPRPAAAPSEARCFGRRCRVVAMVEAGRRAAGGGREGRSCSRRRRGSRDRRVRRCWTSPTGRRSDRDRHHVRASDALWKPDGGNRADARGRARARLSSSSFEDDRRLKGERGPRIDARF